MLSQNTALWLRQKWMQARRLPKAFVSSAGILNLPITSLPVDNFKDRALWCKPTGINYNIHGWILCRYCVTGWFWWISGLRAVTQGFTKTLKKSSKSNIIRHEKLLEYNDTQYSLKHLNHSLDVPGKFGRSQITTKREELRVLEQISGCRKTYVF